MNLQTRKLYIINYLAQIQDENLFSKIEKLILKSPPKENSKISNFTVEELISRIKKSEDDFANGRIKTQDEIEKISEKW